MNDPTVCSKPGCVTPPVMQYRQTGPDTSTVAYFACDAHKYTDPNQQAGTHALNCTRFPCTCTPQQDPAGIDAP